VIGGIDLSWEKGKTVKIIIKRFKYKCSFNQGCEFRKGSFCSKREFCEYRTLA